jgi:di/tricarboxylate transporter
VDKVSWSTVLLVGGVITYVGVLQRSGAIDSVGQGVSGIGAPLLAALLLCYIGGVVSAFASSVAVLGATIPLAVPFLQQGQIGSVGMIAALAIASTIVDVSPFSTNGALVVANSPPEERDAIYTDIPHMPGAVNGRVHPFGPVQPSTFGRGRRRRSLAR